MNIRNIFFPFARCITLIVLLLLCSNAAVAQSASNLLSPKGVAKLYIYQDNAQQPIRKDVKQTAAMRIVNSDKSTYGAAELYDGRIKIEGRGNYTWSLPKKPYNIDLINNAGEDNPAPLLGMPADEEWCLIANYADKSLLRIPLAYNLGEIIGMEWSPHLRFVEVWLNDRYEGLYCLCEKIKRAEKRVNIKKLDKTSEADKISGGYILEVMPEERLTVSDTFIYTPRKIFEVKYPKAKNISVEQCAWISDYINEFETVLYGTDYKDPINGYAKYIDVNTFVDLFLIYTLAKESNLMWGSTFFTKDRNDKLKAGPLWDFDIAFGNYLNVNEFGDGLFRNNAVWFEQLLQDEDFTQKCRMRYDELKSKLDSIPIIIQKNADQLIATGAISRNFERWQILGNEVYPNIPPYPQTYEGEIERLIDWIKARNSWLNVYLGTSDTERCEKLANEKIPLRAYDTDKFWYGDTTIIRAVRGYGKYIWNDRDTTETNEYQVTKTGAYWVQVIDTALHCASAKSEPIVFVDGIDRQNVKVALLQERVNTLLYSNSVLRDSISNLQALLDVCGNTSVQQPAKSLQVYPNPAKDGQLTVLCEEFNAGDKIEIYTLHGELMLIQTVVSVNTEISLSALSAGAYIVRLNNKVAKVIKN